MREYTGTIEKVSRETFMLTYDSRTGAKRLAAKIVTPVPTQKLTVGSRVRIIGDWVGNLGAGALTTFSVRHIEFLG